MQWLSSALAVVPPADGQPHETGNSAGTRLFSLGADGVGAEPIAVCDGPGATMCVLVRTTAVTGVRSYTLRTVGTMGPLEQRPIKQVWLFEPGAIPTTGNVWTLMAGPLLVISSTQRWQSSVSQSPTGKAPTTTVTITLGKIGKGLLRGLFRVARTSLRLLEAPS